MVERKVRYWFSATRRTTSIVHYIVSAESMEKVKENFGILERLYDYKWLTWSELSDLTGCLKSIDVSGRNLAVGDLMFNGKEKRFIIRVTD